MKPILTIQLIIQRKSLTARENPGKRRPSGGMEGIPAPAGPVWAGDGLRSPARVLPQHSHLLLHRLYRIPYWRSLLS